VLLIAHGLISVALLGAITHQAVSVSREGVQRGTSFTARYVAVNQRVFTRAVIVLFLASFILGAVIYPYYRLNVRIPFEEMQLAAAVGVFELKEHFAGIALGMLPLYALVWQPEAVEAHRTLRIALTLLLAFVVWWNFLIGHILNNIRGFV
jgi:hypothetical protein